MEEISIIPLGTVSPYCKGNMNCPGYLIQYKNEKILLDCGNGITRMLDFPNDLKNLHVFITHFHKDHFGDIGALQYASYIYHNLGLLDNKIKIYLPGEDLNYNKQAITSTKESYCEYKMINNQTKYNLDNLEISFKDNESHQVKSYMIKLENENFKIVYTSDVGNKNLNKLIEFCKDSDLIICESTYLEKHNQKSNTHLTAKQAGMIGKLSNTKQLLLTHFWPEEAKNLYLEEAKLNFKNTQVAEEGKKLVLKR